MIKNLKIKDSFLLEQPSFSDERGCFSEYLTHQFRTDFFKNFIQQNLSVS